MSDHDPLQRLLGATTGAVDLVTVHRDGRMEADAPAGVAVLPGSFDPLHRGHERLAEAASQLLSAEVAFELSVVNVDKPALDEAEVRRRAQQFRGRWRVLLTRAPTFVEKARLLPGCTFVIGWDTAVRLVEARYYGGDEAAMLAALDEMRDAGCRFIVAGREHQGSFRTLRDAGIPPRFGPIFEAIPESRFRADVSSTELRKE